MLSVVRAVNVCCENCEWRGKVSAGKRPEFEMVGDMEFPDPCPICGHYALQYAPPNNTDVLSTY